MVKRTRSTVRDSFSIDMDILIYLSQQPSSMSEIGTNVNLTWSKTKSKVETLVGFGLVEKYPEETARDCRIVNKFRGTKKCEDLLELVKLVHKNAPVEIPISIPKRS